MTKKTNPSNSVSFSLSDDLLKSEKIATPKVINKASTYCDDGYMVPFNTLPMTMTGMILEDLKTVCTGKETYFRDAYCDQELMVFDKAQGVKATRGALLLAKIAPCLSFTATMATKTAKKRFEKTQNAALGNIPLGTRGVSLNLVVMINSCMYPHVKYDACRPIKHIKNLKACLKNSGLE